MFIAIIIFIIIITSIIIINTIIIIITIIIMIIVTIPIVIIVNIIITRVIIIFITISIIDCKNKVVFNWFYFSLIARTKLFLIFTTVSIVDCKNKIVSRQRRKGLTLWKTKEEPKCCLKSSNGSINNTLICAKSSIHLWYTFAEKKISLQTNHFSFFFSLLLSLS